MKIKDKEGKGYTDLSDFSSSTKKSNRFSKTRVPSKKSSKKEIPLFENKSNINFSKEIKSRNEISLNLISKTIEANDYYSTINNGELTVKNIKKSHKEDEYGYYNTNFFIQALKKENSNEIYFNSPRFNYNNYNNIYNISNYNNDNNKNTSLSKINNPDISINLKLKNKNIDETKPQISSRPLNYKPQYADLALKKKKRKLQSAGNSRENLLKNTPNFNKQMEKVILNPYNEINEENLRDYTLNHNSDINEQLLHYNKHQKKILFNNNSDDFDKYIEEEDNEHNIKIPLLKETSIHKKKLSMKNKGLLSINKFFLNKYIENESESFKKNIIGKDLNLKIPSVSNQKIISSNNLKYLLQNPHLNTDNIIKKKK